MREVSNVIINNLTVINKKVFMSALAVIIEDSVKQAEKLLKANQHQLIKTMSTMSAYEIMIAVERPFLRLIESDNLTREEKLQLMDVDYNTDWNSFFDGMDSIPKIRTAEIERIRVIWSLALPELKKIDFPDKRDPILEGDI